MLAKMTLNERQIKEIIVAYLKDRGILVTGNIHPLISYGQSNDLNLDGFVIDIEVGSKVVNLGDEEVDDVVSKTHG